MQTAASTDTKARILAIAVKLFAAKGYSGVSMRDIADAVGISAPALYNHFSNKDVLYRAAIERAFADKAEQMLRSISGNAPALERLERFVAITTRNIHDDSEFRRLLERELLDGDRQRLQFLGNTIFQPIQRPFMALLDELKPDCDAFVLSEMIFGMIKQHESLSLLHPFLDDAAATKREPGQISAQVMAVLLPYFQEK